ncbi:MAG TPA: sugar phosphate nucleotidyltransferase [Chitinophagaceae bacterium]|nr:nucleotidyltransferase [Chitinophagaceae bacterium]MCC6634458.1 nucleotidyltransferase [Chitinophagaceae bacterium]HMZ45247.1 sugar phosphate nucleotidyltransferase [Chitinophagaceae bacterium]HNF29661.1 sugar phosphate nucleotidyltransferase [Chitinophagaceae bacterium]HNJ58009.1 sugar phosphate nucleotidyltransferase [Chitinophagaceae bacterium]
MQPTLVILAAGMASRYGSMKQIQGFGPSGETIMEYSIYDAIQAGFGKVVFIIREEFVDMFKENFGKKLEGKIKVDYVYQQLDSYTFGRTIPEERKKPWGTAHAILCCKEKVNEPFAVINADDYYGKNAFVKAHQFLTTVVAENNYAIIGYELKKTLSENGSVSRGVCDVDEEGNLIEINERTKIYKNEKGVITYEDETGLHEVSEAASVSMNFFGFHPNFILTCEKYFSEFLDNEINNPKSEFFIPLVVDKLVKSNTAKVSVIPTTAQWFGVTYKEDAPGVQASINNLIQQGQYPNNLWA